MNKQGKIKQIYGKIKDEFYLCRPDLRIGNSSYNSHLLFQILTQLNNGTQLIYGSYGGGKTTSSEYLNTIFYGLPLEIVKGAVIRGNAGITEEKVTGRPDYGDLQKGEERVRWQKFCLIPPKIWDEMPRTPESTQSIALAGIEEGSWTYLNEHILEGRRPFYATANYSDRGSFTIIPALLDRFDVATVAKFPGLTNSRIISRRYNKEQEQLLMDEKISREAVRILLEKSNYEAIHKNLKPLREEFLGKLNKNGIPTLSEEEKSEINNEISNIKVDSIADLYSVFLTAELNVPSNGVYLRNLLEQKSESRRLDQVVIRYAQSLAWLQGKDKVDLEDVLKVAPYALWHKVEWKDNVKSGFTNYDGSDLELAIAKKMLDEGTQQIPGLKKRMIENLENVKKVKELIEQAGDQKKAKELEELLKTITSNNATHPYFRDMNAEIGDFEE
ncbi:MAG: ATPase associated with various cellular activity AAA_5 [archaeon GW2011_AR20]|nr:MAG: ATPase associated with various cellular activity AAA_5 [archaeon GW2011_AR20]MBS3160067.1 hypothetical protein [Candidatus Woesearchaeota archaeon]